MASKPSKPTQPAISSITDTSFRYVFKDGDNNGASITSRQVGYGTNSSDPQHIISSGLSGTISGLSRGGRYYLWARTTNSEGTSAWSSRSSIQLFNVPAAPSDPVLEDVQPTSVTISWTPNGNGGSAITGYEVGWGTTHPTPQHIVPATSPFQVTGLTPGVTYFFLVRAKNKWGTGGFSGIAQTLTVAGARVLVGLVWKLAVPYVRVAGVWKHAQPWVNVAGEWEETI